MAGGHPPSWIVSSLAIGICDHACCVVLEPGGTGAYVRGHSRRRLQHRTSQVLGRKPVPQPSFPCSFALPCPHHVTQYLPCHGTYAGLKCMHASSDNCQGGLWLGKSIKLAGCAPSCLPAGLAALDSFPKDRAS
jgi:hypothetical protein